MGQYSFLWVKTTKWASNASSGIYVSMLKKYIDYSVSVLPIEKLCVNENLYDEEVPFEILDSPVKTLRNKEVASKELLWRNHQVESASREAEANMKSRYPHIFSPTPIQIWGS